MTELEIGECVVERLLKEGMTVLEDREVVIEAGELGHVLRKETHKPRHGRPD